MTGYDREPARLRAAAERARTVGVVVVVALLGAASLSLAAGATEPFASGAAKPTPGKAFADRVLDEAILPPGARVTTSAGSAPLDAPFETIDPEAAIDIHRYYFVDESPEAVESYLEAHTPPGSKLISEGAITDTSDGDLPGIVYSIPVSGEHDVEADLDYLSGAVAGGAMIRVDAETVWEPSRPRTERAPDHGVVEVTGFSRSSVMRGSSGPVTFVVPAARARSVIGVLNALPLGPSGICMEDVLLFEIAVRPSKGSPPLFEAEGWQCPPEVEVTEHGRSMPALYDANCALLRAVVKVLPVHEAEATREAAIGCDPSAAPKPVHSSRVPPAARARLATIARDMAKANGDPHVEAVQAVATSHAQALRVATPGDSTPSIAGSEPVYLILLRGSFTAYDASPPSGAPLPTGSFLCVVVDQKTFQVTDWGLSRHPPPIALSSLGSVATISLAPTPSR